MVGVCIGLTTLSADEAGITPCHGAVCGVDQIVRRFF
jgi:hypothetical protein